MAEAKRAQDCCPVQVVSCCPPQTDCCAVPRRFMTKVEKKEALEKYRDELRKELEGVEQRLQELGKQ